MPFRPLLAALALFATLGAAATAAVAAPAHPQLYDSILSASEAYARTDPSQAPEPAIGVLLAMGAGMLIVALVHQARALRAPDASAYVADEALLGAAEAP